MTDTGLTIDPSSFVDNPGDHQVEFDATVDAEVQAFAVKYSVLEALAGDARLDDPLAVAQRHHAPLAIAAGKAAGRGQTGGTVSIGESDLV